MPHEPCLPPPPLMYSCAAISSHPLAELTFSGDEPSSIAHDAALCDFGSFGAGLNQGVDEDALQLLLVASAGQIVDAQPSVGNEEVRVFQFLLFQRSEFHSSVHVGRGNALGSVGSRPNESLPSEVQISFVLRLLRLHLLSLVRQLLRVSLWEG